MHLTSETSTVLGFLKLKSQVDVKTEMHTYPFDLKHILRITYLTSYRSTVFYVCL